MLNFIKALFKTKPTEDNSFISWSAYADYAASEITRLS